MCESVRGKQSPLASQKSNQRIGAPSRDARDPGMPVGPHLPMVHFPHLVVDTWESTVSEFLTRTPFNTLKYHRRTPSQTRCRGLTAAESKGSPTLVIMQGALGKAVLSGSTPRQSRYYRNYFEVYYRMEPGTDLQISTPRDDAQTHRKEESRPLWGDKSNTVC